MSSNGSTRRSPPKKRKRVQTRLINKKSAFLAAFIESGSLTEAAEAVGINRRQHYEWLAKDPKYVAAFEAAKPQAAQTLHDLAVKRVKEGEFIPNVYQGRFCYPQEFYEKEPAKPAIEAAFGVDARPAVPAVIGIRDIPDAAPLGRFRRSEMLHLALLRAHIPEFRNSTIELTGKDGGEIEIGIVDRLNAARNRLAAAKAQEAAKPDGAKQSE